ncbi:hypothetical protein BC628DRAFT_220549 [Trametes gibbosa]|nr:hypothetical protein BC628DRAFT_220549 [Trametes gibbosa]
MQTIKRILQFKLTPAGPPPRTKAYCRYPGCGRLFKPIDALEEFCSRQCLQDYNYTPPAPWYLSPAPRYGRQGQGRWWWSRKDHQGPQPWLQRSASTIRYSPALPAPHRWDQIRQRTGHRHSQSHHGLFDHNPPQAQQAPFITPSQPRPLSPPAYHGPNVPAPKLRLRKHAHDLPRPPSTKFRNKPLPPIQPHPPVPPVPPKDLRHVPHVVSPNAQTISHRRNAPPGPSPASFVSPTPRPHAPSRREPRPRSNSFGGFRFPPPPRQH